MAQLASALALVLLSYVSTVRSHGYITIPAAKQLVNNQFGVTWQHGNSIGNGGGRPIANPGVCGDPFQESNPSSSVWSTPFNTNTQRVYSQGGLIPITLTLTANHGGRHSFRICPSTSPSDACFGTNWLTATGNPTGGENPKEGKRFWYINFQGNARFAQQPWETYTSTWRLPAGISCTNGCLLQWRWSAYQNCALPCENASWDDSTRCGLDQRGNRQICDGSALLFTENFQNCADIKITGGSTTNPISSPPPPAATVASPPPPAGGGGGSTTCPISSAYNFCLAKGAGIWADPCACNAFFNCGPGGQGARMVCGAPLLFNPTAKVCDWDYNVRCTTTGR